MRNSAHPERSELSDAGKASAFIIAFICGEKSISIHHECPLENPDGELGITTTIPKSLQQTPSATTPSALALSLGAGAPNLLAKPSTILC
jgi:hypothetical protein